MLVKVAGWSGVAAGALNMAQAIVFCSYSLTGRRYDLNPNSSARLLAASGGPPQLLEGVAIDLADMPLLPSPDQPETDEAGPAEQPTEHQMQ